MSAAATARATPRPRLGTLPGTAPARRPRLRLVQPPQQARVRVPFVLTCMGVLALALVSALLLTTSTAQVAFSVSARQASLTRLQQDATDLQATIDQASAPAQLATSARRLGMVPTTGTGWVRLSDGTVSAAPGVATK